VHVFRTQHPIKIYCSACRPSFVRSSAPPDGPFGTTPDKLPFEAYFTVRNLYVFFGLALLTEMPPDMVPDPAFSPVPVALNNLFVVQNASGPCGPVEWVCCLPLISAYPRVWFPSCCCTLCSWLHSHPSFHVHAYLMSLLWPYRRHRRNRDESQEALVA
jgi:hypothetical protein